MNGRQTKRPILAGLAVTLGLWVVGCSSGGNAIGATGEADLTGSSADHECRIVLRTARSNLTTFRDPRDGRAWVVYGGSIDVAETIAASAQVPAVKLQYKGSTGVVTTVQATPSKAPSAPGGFVRFDFVTTTDTFLANTGHSEEIDMIPFLENADGTRVFDHNRTNGDYALSHPFNFEVVDDPNACPATKVLPGTSAAPARLPLLRNVDETLPAGGEQVFFFAGRQRQSAQLVVQASNQGGPAFIPHVTLKNRDTGRVLLESDADVSGLLTRNLNLPDDGTYLLSVRASDQRSGAYFIALMADFPCAHAGHPDANCPAELTCKELKDPWAWSSVPGPKCLP